MKQIGTYLLIFGLGSLALSFFDMNFRLLMWIDSWGPTVGMAIRLGAAIIGGALMFLGRERTEDSGQA